MRKVGAADRRKTAGSAARFVDRRASLRASAGSEVVWLDGRLQGEPCFSVVAVADHRDDSMLIDSYAV